MLLHNGYIGFRLTTINMKRFALFVLCMLFATQGQAASFPDTATSQFEAEIANLKASGAASGYPEDGTFRPNKWINRAEFVKILLEYNQDVQGSGPSMCFTDFNPGDFETAEWYYAYACEAKTLGYIQGYPDGSFGGEKNINLAEALKIVISAKHLPIPHYIQEPEHWYDPFFIIADELHLFHKIARDPAHFVTRGEMAFIVVTIVNSSTVGTVSSVPSNCMELKCPAGPMQPAFAMKCGDPARETGCYEQEFEDFDCVMRNSECIFVGKECSVDSECDDQHCEVCNSGRCETLCKKNERCDNFSGSPLQCYIICNEFNPCPGNLQCKQDKCV